MISNHIFRPLCSDRDHRNLYASGCNDLQSLLKYYKNKKTESLKRKKYNVIKVCLLFMTH